MKKYLLFSLLFIGWLACRKEKTAPRSVSEAEPLVVPDGFPAPVFPAGNELTEARWLLGKRLFYSLEMSRDRSISCASCHHLSKAFADSVAFSPGVGGAAGVRNTPSLANVAYHPYFTREGGVPTLEQQVGVPIQEHNEFDFNILLIAERLKNDSIFRKMSLEAYSREPDAFVITRAIACFERTILSGQSRYDDWLFRGEHEALSQSEKRGKDLFFSKKTDCAACHGGFNFTNYQFENNGLYKNYPDPGRFRLTENEADRGRFKVASLRNVGLTAPFMHDGSLPTIEAVIEHYNSGGKTHPNKNPLIRPLGLSAKEKADLVAFLKSLTDEKLAANPKFY